MNLLRNLTYIYVCFICWWTAVVELCNKLRDTSVRIIEVCVTVKFVTCTRTWAPFEYRKLYIACVLRLEGIWWILRPCTMQRTCRVFHLFWFNTNQVLQVIFIIFSYSEKVKAGVLDCDAVSVSVCLPINFNTWTSLYETWYVYRGTWAHLNSVFYKSLQSVCISVCVFSSPYGGWIEYLHRNPASCRRRRKGKS
jgi:hypothetical protein